MFQCHVFVFKFFDNYMLYENVIGLHYNDDYNNDNGYNKGVANTSPIDPEYK